MTRIEKLQLGARIAEIVGGIAALTSVIILIFEV